MASTWLDSARVIHQLGLAGAQLESGPGWDLRCPVCHGWLPSGLLVVQMGYLARHLVEVHPYEASLLATLLPAARARAYAGG